MKLKILILFFCCFVFTSVAQSADFTAINTAGIHDIASAQYDSSTGNPAINASAKDITVNVGDGGGILQFGNPQAPVTAPTSPTWFLNSDSGGNLIYNGNLEIYSKRASNGWMPIMANYDASTLTINGNLKAVFDNENSSGNIGTYMIIMMDDAYFTLNGSLDLSGSSTAGNGYAYSWGIHANPNVDSGRPPLPAVINLGKDANDTINFHDINASGTTAAEALGIVGFGYNETDVQNPGEYLINVKGKAYLADISAEISGSGYAIASGAYAQYKGSINFLSDLYINNIAASGNNAEAWALFAAESGIINVNPNGELNNIIRIDGNIGASDDDGSFPDARVNINLTNQNSYFFGETAYSGSAGVNVNLSNGAQWRTRNGFQIDNLNVSGGAIDAAWQLSSGLETPEFQNVTVKNLTGTNPVFIVKTNFDTMQSDVITLTNGFADSALIKVYDIGLENTGTYPAQGLELLVVKAGAGTLGGFTAKETQGSLFNYIPSLRQTGTEVYVTGFKQGDITPSAKTFLDANAAAFAAWRSENSLFRRRMGDLRQNIAVNSGMWIKTYAGRLDKKGEGTSFNSNYILAEIGADKKYDLDKLSLLTGIAFALRNSSLDYNAGSGESESLSLAFYGAAALKNGWYADIIFRGNYLNNKIKTVDSVFGPVDGHYSGYGLALQAEAGKYQNLGKGFFVEPFAMLSAGTLGGRDYDAGGVHVSHNSASSLTAAAGAYLGYEKLINSKMSVFYARINAAKEFAGNVETEIRNDIGERYNINNKFNDFWAEFGIGASIAFMPALSATFDISSAAGTIIQMPLQGSIILRWAI